MTSWVEKRTVMDEDGIRRALRRLATEIVEKEHGVTDLVFVGIHTGGVFLAARLAKMVEELESKAPPTGSVDITLYRDDALQGLPRPEIGATTLPFKLSDKKVVLVDDVLYTGRTVRAALDALNDYGRPKRVRLAVLVDRGYRELPIQADYVGLKLATERDESVKVRLVERGGVDRVIIRRRDTTPKSVALT